MDITLDYTVLLEEVKRSLSIIGKRSTDDNGNLLFTDITVSTNEEYIIIDYFQQAVIDLAAELSGFITTPATAPATFPGGFPTGATITIDLPSNHSEAVEPFIQQSCNAYCVSYALYSWFTVTAPRISEKYNADCSRRANAVLRLVHQKEQPDTPELTYADIPGSVILNS